MLNERGTGIWFSFLFKEENTLEESIMLLLEAIFAAAARDFREGFEIEQRITRGEYNERYIGNKMVYYQDARWFLLTNPYNMEWDGKAIVRMLEKEVIDTINAGGTFLDKSKKMIKAT